MLLDKIEDGADSRSDVRGVGREGRGARGCHEKHAAWATKDGEPGLGKGFREDADEAAREEGLLRDHRTDGGPQPGVSAITPRDAIHRELFSAAGGFRETVFAKVPLHLGLRGEGLRVFSMQGNKNGASRDLLTPLLDDGGGPVEDDAGLEALDGHRGESASVELEERGLIGMVVGRAEQGAIERAAGDRGEVTLGRFLGGLFLAIVVGEVTLEDVAGEVRGGACDRAAGHALEQGGSFAFLSQRADADAMAFRLGDEHAPEGEEGVGAAGGLHLGGHGLDGAGFGKDGEIDAGRGRGGNGIPGGKAGGSPAIGATGTPWRTIPPIAPRKSLSILTARTPAPEVISSPGTWPRSPPGFPSWAVLDMMLELARGTRGLTGPVWQELEVDEFLEVGGRRGGAGRFFAHISCHGGVGWPS